MRFLDLEAEPARENVTSILPIDELSERLQLIEQIEDSLERLYDDWEPDRYGFATLLLAPIRILRQFAQTPVWASLIKGRAQLRIWRALSAYFLQNLRKEPRLLPIEVSRPVETCLKSKIGHHRVQK